MVNRLLEDERVNPASEKINCAINYAISNYHIDIFKRLLQDSRINCNLDTAKRLARQYGHHDMQNLLIRCERENS